MLCPHCGTDVGEVVALCDGCLTKVAKGEAQAVQGYERPDNTNPSSSSERYLSNDTQDSSEETHTEVTDKASQELEFAGFWLRWVAVGVDFGLISLFRLAILYGFVFLSLVSVDAVLKSLSVTNGEVQKLQLQGLSAGALIAVLVAFIVYAASGWLYYALFERSTYQATPGKIFLGLKVTDTLGNRLTFLRATGRFFARFVSMLIPLIGLLIVAILQSLVPSLQFLGAIIAIITIYILYPLALLMTFAMAGFSRYKQGFHDILAHCLVVKPKPVTVPRIVVGIIAGTLLIFLVVFTSKVSLLAIIQSYEFSDGTKSTIGTIISQHQHNDELNGNFHTSQELQVPSPVPPQPTASADDESASPDTLEDIPRTPTTPLPGPAGKLTVGDSHVAFKDSFVNLRTEADGTPALEIAFFSSTLSANDKVKLKSHNALWDLKSSSAVQLPEFLLLMTFRPGARSCNPLALRRMYIKLFSTGKAFKLPGNVASVATEDSQDNWAKLVRESGLICALNSSGAVNGRIKGETTEYIEGTPYNLSWELIIDRAIDTTH